MALNVYRLPGPYIVQEVDDKGVPTGTYGFGGTEYRAMEAFRGKERKGRTRRRSGVYGLLLGVADPKTKTEKAAGVK